jgi:predicted nucleotidyltransferase
MRTPAELRPLVRAIEAKLAPDAIWLFGSRARGDNRQDSDWDLVVALSDDAPAELFDPIVGWRIQHEIGIPATILAATTSELTESWGAPNTLGYVLARDGRLLDR